MALSYLEFAKRMGVELTPGQLAFAAVAFDGRPIAEVGPLAVELFGTAEAFNPAALGCVVEVAGARSGKTYLNALRLLHLAVSADLGRLAPGEDAFCLFIAPLKALACQGVKYALGAVKKSSLKGALVGKATDEEFALQVGTHRVVFQAAAASVGGISGRGKSLVGAFLDECAFFRDADYQINDQEIYNAVGPRIMEGGQLLLGSTPWGEAGLLFDLWKENFGKPKEALVAHATTTRMRQGGPSWKKISNEIENARHRDPENAQREFDAEFMSGSAGTFFDPTAVDYIVRPNEMVVDPTPGAEVMAAADFGFKHDSSALAICQKIKGKVYLSCLVEKKPEKGRALKPSEVVREFAAHMRRYGVKAVMADGHHRESLQEHLSAEGIALVACPEGATGKPLTYNRAKERIYEGSVVIPQADRLIRQLKEVIAKPLSGGGISIQSPRWKQGGHGDLVSAFVLALYQVQGRTIATKVERTFGQTMLDGILKAEEKAKKERNRWQQHMNPLDLLN